MKRRGLWLAGAVLAGLIAWWAWPRTAAVPEAQAAVPARNHLALPTPAASVGASRPEGSPFTDAALRERMAQRDQLVQRLERAKLTLATYREQTRYPHESRPIDQHPDQIHPFAPIRESLPLRFPGSKGAVPGVRILTTQDRVFMSGDEIVKISVSAQDEAGRTLPLLITRAVAFDLPDPRQAAGRPQLALDFTGSEGVYSAQFQPSRTAFADFAGTLRLQAILSQDGRQGVVNFDVVYQPLVPAEWGAISERVADGSLDFLVGINVKQTGRYVVNARVDDAKGQPFALVSFNEELGVGAQTARLRVFGKLLRDGAPAMPLKLRDLQGFLLMEDRFPDRAMLARREGVVYWSGSYALRAFSDAEWTSEERDRYLAELGKDVSQLEAQLKPPGR
ncbi:hypothetical protein J2X20_004277 [Pelomonas saccharophila]|uniref:Uncharacterized protein n=1 Tax=Roseateles saccharophilus TaxID=304 RepID=A0ABU1YRX6_ROSSA|nr:hypothetical protein [Roseateles saccharophilus]MDR7271609.1 hypothetical protein [Roseateles saccharophilus]